MAKESARLCVSALLIHAAIFAWTLAPVPAFAKWWVVRSADEQCLVVDVEPFPGSKDVTRLGNDSYPSEQEAQADLQRLCPESSYGP